MIPLILAIAFATLLTTAPVHAGPREDAVIACLIGQAGVVLYKNIQKDLHRKMDARTATDAALASADKRCMKLAVDVEGGSDYVYYSVYGMAKAWFPDNAGSQ
jgi:hypothetical protein